MNGVAMHTLLGRSGCRASKHSSRNPGPTPPFRRVPAGSSVPRRGPCHFRKQSQPHNDPVVLQQPSIAAFHELILLVRQVGQISRQRPWPQPNSVSTRARESHRTGQPVACPDSGPKADVQTAHEAAGLTARSRRDEAECVPQMDAVTLPCRVGQMELFGSTAQPLLELMTIAASCRAQRFRRNLRHEARSRGWSPRRNDSAATAVAVPCVPERPLTQTASTGRISIGSRSFHQRRLCRSRTAL